MKTSIQNISIPNQCSQPWDEMTPTKQGRHCDACQKVVIDFTSMTDQELIYYFEKRASEKFCGRFKKAQLEKVNRRLSILYKSGIKEWAKYLLIGVFLPVANGLYGQSEIDLGYTLKKHGMLAIPEKSEFIWVEGKLLDTDGPLLFANVYISGTKVGLQTDINGKFKLEIPLTEIENIDSTQITFAYVGHSVANINLAEVKNQNIEVQLKDYHFLSGEVIIISPWYKRWWKKLKRKLRF